MSIGVVILTKNNNDVIERCLNSFKHNTYKELKFYIGDTGSCDISLNKLTAFLKDFPYKKELLKFKSWNFARNNNHIINNRVTEEKVLVCNDDVELINDPIPKMLKHLDSRTASVGAKLLFANNTIQHGGHLHFFRKYDNQNLRSVTHRYLNNKNKDLSTDKVPGNTFAFALLCKNIFNKLGGIPEYYKICYEDVEYCINALLKDYIHVFCGEAECYHYESTSRKTLNTGAFDWSDGERITNILNNPKLNKTNFKKHSPNTPQHYTI